jgi:hypothetical protein
VETLQLQEETQGQHLLNLHLAYLTHHVDLLEINDVGYVLEEVLFVRSTRLVDTTETQHVAVVEERRDQRV